MLFVLFLSWCCHCVCGDRDVLKSLPVVQSGSGKHSQGGSSCPEWGGQGEEGAPGGCWRWQTLAEATESVGW